MRFLFRWAFRLVVLLVVFAVLAVLGRDWILLRLFESRIRSATGADVRLGTVQTGLISPFVRLGATTFFDRAEFGGGPLAIVREAYAEYDRLRIPNGMVRLKLLRLRIAELTVVENERGFRNLTVLQAVLRRIPAQTSLTNAWAFGGVETLNLSIDKVKVLSLRKPESVREYAVRVENDLLRDVRSAEEILNHLLRVLERRGVEFRRETRL